MEINRRKGILRGEYSLVIVCKITAFWSFIAISDANQQVYKAFNQRTLPKSQKLNNSTIL